MTTKEFPVLCVWVNAPLAEEPGAHPYSCLKLLERFGFRTRFLVMHQSKSVQKDTSDRNDVFFLLHKDDIAKFSVSRFRLFSIETGFLYGIVYKDDNKSIEEKKNFILHHGCSSFAITDEFDQFSLFKIKLFDINQANKEHIAQQSIEEFIQVVRQFEQEFPNCKTLKFFESGFIRWWDDIVDNGHANMYPEEILKAIGVAKELIEKR